MPETLLSIAFLQGSSFLSWTSGLAGAWGPLSLLASAGILLFGFPERPEKLPHMALLIALELLVYGLGLATVWPILFVSCFLLATACHWKMLADRYGAGVRHGLFAISTFAILLGMAGLAWPGLELTWVGLSQQINRLPPLWSAVCFWLLGVGFFLRCFFPVIRSDREQPATLLLLDTVGVKIPALVFLSCFLSRLSPLPPSLTHNLFTPGLVLYCLHMWIAWSRNQLPDLYNNVLHGQMGLLFAALFQEAGGIGSLGAVRDFSLCCSWLVIGLLLVLVSLEKRSTGLTEHWHRGLGYHNPKLGLPMFVLLASLVGFPFLGSGTLLLEASQACFALSWSAGIAFCGATFLANARVLHLFVFLLVPSEHHKATYALSGASLVMIWMAAFSAITLSLSRKEFFGGTRVVERSELPQQQVPLSGVLESGS